jgi:outer membrane receptor protein involved in Fe transport
VLTSSRELEIIGELKPEEAWNYGVSFTQRFYLGEREGILAVDFYRTDFQNQVIVDRDRDVHKIFFYNLNGKSFSNSFQAELSYEVASGLDAKVAYKLDDVHATISDELLRAPLIPRHRGLFNISYLTQKENWQFDVTTQLIGKSRLPDTEASPEIYQQRDYSSVYPQLFMQVTKKFKNIDLYIGGENITGFKQDNPIIAADDPYGSYFDASMVWGPIFGRKLYGGLKFRIN